jgi:hypothetical protein
LKLPLLIASIQVSPVALLRNGMLSPPPSPKKSPTPTTA